MVANKKMKKKIFMHEKEDFNGQTARHAPGELAGLSNTLIQYTGYCKTL